MQVESGALGMNAGRTRRPLLVRTVFGAGLYYLGFRLSTACLQAFLSIPLTLAYPLRIPYTMSVVEQHMAVAKQKKDVGDQAFKAGETVNGTARHRVSSPHVRVLAQS